MYTHTIAVTVQDDVVHQWSIMEWEEILLRNAVIERDELPLSYGRIAEILAEEYHRYGANYFASQYAADYTGGPNPASERISTAYTDDAGRTVSTRVERPSAAYQAAPDAREASSRTICEYPNRYAHLTAEGASQGVDADETPHLAIGVTQYGTSRRKRGTMTAE